MTEAVLDHGIGATLRRIHSQHRDHLFPHQPNVDERRVETSTRQRALSAQPGLRVPLIPFDQRSAPDTDVRIHDTRFPAAQVEGRKRNAPIEFDDSRGVEAGLRNLTIFGPHERQTRSDVNGSEHMHEEAWNPDLQDELEKKWILNLSMHFRDDGNREKFFITYCERLNLWRRLTISCDYRDAPPNSLESDLRTLHYQRDKSAFIYDAIKDALNDIHFFDTVTNIRLETVDGELQIHPLEDVNEIIPYPSLGAVDHLARLGCKFVYEEDVCFSAHLSGFAYKVTVGDETYVKKEIPSPDTIEEFLYEANALFSLRNDPHLIGFAAIVISGSSKTVTNGDTNGHTRDNYSTPPHRPPPPLIKGLLISFAPSGALVDLLLTHTDSPTLPPISWPRRLKWAHHIISGLSSIHSHGFVQGDLTLSNVVIDAHDTARIIDINRRGCPMGWEPPELEGLIRSGQRLGMYIGVKTDIWQLGMCLWALAMHNPEPEREEEDLDFDDEDGRVAHVGHGFRNVVRCCLAPDPAQRKSAAELLVMLEQDRAADGWSLDGRLKDRSQAMLSSQPALLLPEANSSSGNNRHYGPEKDLEMVSHDASLEREYRPPMHQDSGFLEGQYSNNGSQRSYSFEKASQTSSYDMPKELLGIGSGHRQSLPAIQYDSELDI